MSRRSWLPLAVLGLLVAELVVFIAVGTAIGFGWTLLLVLLASLTGLILLRREGLRAWRRFRAALEAGTPRGEQATDGVVGLGGALLLAAPGLVSGVIGATLLLPPVRRSVRRRMRSRAERWLTPAQAGQYFGPRRVRVEPADPGQDAELVEGEIVDADPRRPPRPS